MTLEYRVGTAANRITLTRDSIILTRMSRRIEIPFAEVKAVRISKLVGHDMLKIVPNKGKGIMIDGTIVKEDPEKYPLYRKLVTDLYSRLESCPKVDYVNGSSFWYRFALLALALSAMVFFLFLFVDHSIGLPNVAAIVIGVGAMIRILKGGPPGKYDPKEAFQKGL